MPNQRNAVQTDIDTLKNISQTLSNTEQVLREYALRGYDVDPTFIEDIATAKNKVDDTVDILDLHYEKIADIYQAPPPRSETF